MAQSLNCLLFQTVVCLIFGLNTISKAQNPDGFYGSRFSKGYIFQNWETDSKVSLKIYYETHCPYTIRFFKEQLAPTVEHLAAHLDIYMIPYGHAKTKYENGEYTFSCQHGDIECYGNKLHACAIDVIGNNTKAALFNICIMDSIYDYNALNLLVNECGERLNILTAGIWDCLRSKRSTLLLKQYGDETRALRPRRVPHVVLGESAEDQGVITQYLGYSVCRLLTPRPQVCRL